MRVYRSIPITAALAAAVSMGHAPAAAQSTTSRPVVQAIPSAESAELSDALRQVSRRPNDIPVLIKAGDASLESGDIAAAERFFRRIQDIDPTDPRAKLGLAAVAVRKEDPFTALRLFDEAQAAGVESLKYSGDHGLAYDLIGDTVRAQRFYQLSMAVKPRPEMIRRMALSQAISGDIRGAESTLLPLLRKEDLAAFRTRAFALAIAGKQQEAMSIAQSLMPEASAKRLEPYLNSMPKLTAAQQAAAGNFGHFPLATQVGIDDPRVAAFAAGNVPPIRLAQEASDRLVPQGEPLGANRSAGTQLARAEPQRAATSQPDRVVRRTAQRDLSDISDPLARTRGRRTRVVPASEVQESQAAVAQIPSLPPAEPVATTPATTPIANASPVAAPTTGELPSIGAPSAAPQVVDELARVSNSMSDIAAAPTDIAIEQTSDLPPMVPLQADGVQSVASAEDNAALPAAPTPVPPVAPGPSIAVLGNADQTSANAELAESSAALPSPVTSPVSSPVSPPLTSAPAAANAPVLVSTIDDSPAPSPAIPRAIERVEVEPSTVAQAVAVPTQSAPPTVAQEVVQAVPQIVPPVQTVSAAPASAPVPTPAPAPAPAPEPAPASVADAFADFDLGEPSPAPRPVDAVDITKIDIPIEKAAEEEEAAPAKPTNPSRVWVQIATGQDRSALRYDFRRISRKAPDLFDGKEGFTAKWNETNRLVTGPFENARAARDFVNELKEKEIESFTFTSEDGQQVETLPKR